LAKGPSCTSFSIDSTRADISSAGKPSRRKPKAMFSYTLKWGKSA
jgi:hypothetical protein